MIAVDTNILVYAHRSDAGSHEPARRAIEGLIRSGEAWAITWPSIHEFISIVTRRKIYAQPTPIVLAFEQLAELLRANVALLGESTRHLATLANLAVRGAVSGAQIHDARIAAICLDNGVSELWTADRDFRRFPQLKTRNPMIATPG